MDTSIRKSKVFWLSLFHKIVAVPVLAAAMFVGLAGETVSRADEIGMPELLNIQMKDWVLQDQEGRTVRFLSDVVQDRIAVVNFMYSKCTTACPLTSAIFGKVQEALGKRMDQEVRLISITLDPVSDTPERLKEYSRQFAAGSGWIWLTGGSSTIRDLLQDTKVYVDDLNTHPPVLLIGDGRRQVWTRLYGFQGVKKIMAQIDMLVRSGSQERAEAKLDTLTD
jgi:protein SCO1/2